MGDGENVGPGNQEPTEAAGPAADGPSGGRRILHLLGAVLVGVVLPAVVVGVLVGELGVSALFTGVVWALSVRSSAGHAGCST